MDKNLEKVSFTQCFQKVFIAFKTVVLEFLKTLYEKMRLFRIIFLHCVSQFEVFFKKKD